MKKIIQQLSKSEKAKTIERKKNRKTKLQESENELLELEQIIKDAEMKEIIEMATKEVENNQINIEAIENSASHETKRLMIGIQMEIIKKERKLNMSKIEINEKEALRKAEEKVKKMPEDIEK